LGSFGLLPFRIFLGHPAAHFPSDSFLLLLLLLLLLF
jgi:hypothetical protein